MVPEKRSGYFLALFESMTGGSVMVKIDGWLAPGLYSIMGTPMECGKLMIVEGVVRPVKGSGMLWISYRDTMK